MEWSQLEDLYSRARTDDADAMQRVLDEGNSLLFRWLRRRSAGWVPKWEMEDVAQASIVTTLLSIERIPRWPQAWAFAKTVSIRLLREVKASPIDLPHANQLSHSAHRQPAEHVSRVELDESLLRFLRNLRSDELLILISFVTGRPPLPSLAEELCVSLRTLQRRRLSLINEMRASLFGNI